MKKIAYLVTVIFLIGFFAARISFSEQGIASDLDSTLAEFTKAEDESVVVSEGRETISLDLRGIGMVDFFKILSLKTGINIIPSQNVRGSIDLYLKDVTFEDAFDLILASYGLACEKKGNIINVMTAQEYEALYGRSYNERRISKMLKLKYADPTSVFGVLSQMKTQVGKLVVDNKTATIVIMDEPETVAQMEAIVKELDRENPVLVFDLVHARAEDIKEQITQALSQGPGEVAIDERTNKMVITDLSGRLDKVKSMVKTFDEKVPQVLIESQIMSVSLSDKLKYGIDWNALFNKAKSEYWHGLSFVGKFPLNTIDGSDETRGEVSIGSLDRDGYQAVMTALTTVADVHTLSSPRITALNNQEAKILVGTKEVYVISTISQAQTTTTTAEDVRFIDVGVKLSITPSIGRDGYVTLAIRPEVSETGTPYITSTENKIPIVSTSEMETTVRIKDGRTILIGGLIKTKEDVSNQGLPYLSKIPGLGMLFGSKSREKTKTELVIFLTPHIMRDEDDEDKSDEIVYESSEEKRSLRKPLKEMR